MNCQKKLLLITGMVLLSGSVVCLLIAVPINLHLKRGMKSNQIVFNEFGIAEGDIEEPTARWLAIPFVNVRIPLTKKYTPFFALGFVFICVVLLMRCALKKSRQHTGGSITAKANVRHLHEINNDE